MMRIPPSHEEYFCCAGRIDDAVDALIGVHPTGIASDAPLLDVQENPANGSACIFPFQQNSADRYMCVLPAFRIRLAAPLVQALAAKVDANRRHFPRENTLADRFDVPGLYVRLDCFLVAAGRDGSSRGRWTRDDWKQVALFVCEFDDQPAFVGSFRVGGHPAAYRVFEDAATTIDLPARRRQLAGPPLRNYKPGPCRHDRAGAARRMRSGGPAASLGAQLDLPGARLP
jgi:hypothetical protein